MDNQELTEIRQVQFMLDKQACQDCSRLSGGAWSVKLQVRVSKEDVEKAFELARHFSRKILKIEEQKNGLDVYLFDRSSAAKLASLLRDKLDLRISKTAEAFKMVKGEQVCRDVILLKP